jgi:hypothetical protein
MSKFEKVCIGAVVFCLCLFLLTVPFIFVFSAYKGVICD